MSRKSQIEVDLDGLANLVKDRIDRLALELYQNSRDTKDAKNIKISLAKVDEDSKTRDYLLRVVDDSPCGFLDLSHAYTLFANSIKKKDSSTSGQFNMGEKLLIAVSKKMVISTTTGTIIFDHNERRSSRNKTQIGSDVSCVLSLTLEQVAQIKKNFMSIIVINKDLNVTFNGEKIPYREPLTEVRCTLPSPLAATISDEMKVVNLKATVGIYEPLDGETPFLYEHGIPVVPSGSKWHYLVHQKVPVPFDRDNVPPSYLRKIHVECVNAMFEHITPDDVGENFVTDAIRSDKCNEAAVRSYVSKKYGENPVIFDPSDLEANKIAVSKGMTVVYGAQEPKEIFSNIRKFDVIEPAGKVTPSPKAFSPTGRPVKYLEKEKFTNGINKIIAFSKFLFDKIMIPRYNAKRLEVMIVDDPNAPFLAAYQKEESLDSGSTIWFNFALLGSDWFERDFMTHSSILSLIIHEFAHQVESDHLSEKYYLALSDIGADIFTLLSANPASFDQFKT